MFDFMKDDQKILEWTRSIATMKHKANQYDHMMEILNVIVERHDDEMTKQSGYFQRVTIDFKDTAFMTMKDQLTASKITIQKIREETKGY